MMLKRKTLKIAIILVCVLSISLFLLLKNVTIPTDRNELQPISVRMKWFFAGTMAGWFAGKEEEIFMRHGFEITINPGGPDNNSVKLVAAGTDKFGVAGADEVLLAREKGIPIVAIGVLFKESPICFISKEDKNIKTPKDWSNKTIEVSYGGNEEVQYRALIDKYSPKAIKEVPYTFNLIPFIEDKVDVSVAYKMDQVVTLKRKGINLNIISAKDYGINPYGDVLITTEKTMNNELNLVKQFMEAVVESHRWAIEHPIEAVSYLTKYSPNLSNENELEVWEETIPFLTGEGGISSIGIMERSRWEETKQILVDFAGLPSDTKVESAYRDVLSNQ